MKASVGSFKNWGGAILPIPNTLLARLVVMLKKIFIRCDIIIVLQKEETKMTFEEAKNLFYNNEKVREQFDYWDIDYTIAKINTFINDVEEFVNER